MNENTENTETKRETFQPDAAVPEIARKLHQTEEDRKANQKNRFATRLRQEYLERQAKLQRQLLETQMQIDALMDFTPECVDYMNPDKWVDDMMALRKKKYFDSIELGIVNDTIKQLF